MAETAPLSGPDLVKGVASADVPEGGSLLGHAHGEAVLLVRPANGTAVFAVGANCTHYGGPLDDGCVVGHEVRVPGITRGSTCARALPSQRPRSMRFHAGAWSDVASSWFWRKS
jgi:hypothetical protein